MTTTATSATVPTATQSSQSIQLSNEQIAAFRCDGFTKVEGIISPAEVTYFREELKRAAKERRAANNELSRMNDAVFQQEVNLWTEYESVKELTLHPRVTQAAKQLAGVPLRLWHDHLLLKGANTDTPTEFHQDKPYWPHTRGPESAHPISCWIALVDVPFERGCMSFIPGTHTIDNLDPQDLHDAGSLFGMCPELAWQERRTLPLKAGDCTFHHGYCAHTANGNHTNEDRISHIAIYMDKTTRYDGKNHCVTDGLDLEIDQEFDHPLFPVV